MTFMGVLFAARAVILAGFEMEGGSRKNSTNRKQATRPNGVNPIFIPPGLLGRPEFLSW